MKKTIVSTTLALTLIFTLLTTTSHAAFTENDLYAAWNTESHTWGYSTMMGGYDTDVDLTWEQFKTYGSPVSISPQAKGQPYPICSSLNDIDLVARVIFAEICNLSETTNNAFAVAQIIENRINSSQHSDTARGVVTQAYAFSSVHDGNSRFGDPSLDNNPYLWGKAVFLAAQLVNKDYLPVSESESTDMGIRRFCYDLNWGIPFYKNGVQLNWNTVETATHYNYNGLQPLLAPVIKISDHVYFEYN